MSQDRLSLVIITRLRIKHSLKGCSIVDQTSNCEDDIILLGKYSSIERGKAVLIEIQYALREYATNKLKVVFEMPSE